MKSQRKEAANKGVGPDTVLPGLCPGPRSLTLSGQDSIFDNSRMSAQKIMISHALESRPRIGARVALQRCPVLRPDTRSVSENLFENLEKGYFFRLTRTAPS